MARQRKATTVADVESGTLRFEFVSGGQFVAHIDKLPRNIVFRLALHGLKQKLADGYADPDVDPKEAVSEIYTDLSQGVWSTRGEGGQPRLTQLAKAVFLANAGAENKPAWMENEDTVQAFLDTIYVSGEGADMSFEHVERAEDGSVEWDDAGKAHKAALAMIRKDPAVKAQLDRMALEAAQRRAAASATASAKPTGPSLF